MGETVEMFDDWMALGPGSFAAENHQIANLQNLNHVYLPHSCIHGFLI